LNSTKTRQWIRPKNNSDEMGDVDVDMWMWMWMMWMMRMWVLQPARHQLLKDEVIENM
jgi:hypothetical protein